MPPKITVLMPVYNGERFLSEAIESILDQTFSDFEFLIINDGSGDRSVEIISSYNDPRIRLVHNEKNIGLIATLNKGIGLASGEYIARMDCDDISLKKRLLRQAVFMDLHPETGVCGTWFRHIGKTRGTGSRPPPTPELIRCGLFLNSTLGHPTAMLRRSFFEKYHLAYSPEYKHCEDFELWTRASEFFPLANIPEVLLLYRIHQQQMTFRFAEDQGRSIDKIRETQLHWIGMKFTQEELDFHQAVCSGRFHASRDFLNRADRWLCTIKAANDMTGRYPVSEFSAVLVERWFVLCYRSIEQNFWSLKLFFSANVLQLTARGWKHNSRLLAGAVISMIRDACYGLISG